MSKEEVLTRFRLLKHGSEGIGSWITEETPDVIFDRLSTLDKTPLSLVQLNQLLGFGHEAPVSDGFFQYYWMTNPSDHPYPVEKLPNYRTGFINANDSVITSVDHLFWGMYRLFVDGLLYFGNVRTACRDLRSLCLTELRTFFEKKKIDTLEIKKRGPALEFKAIPVDDRYLISEMACKSYGDAQAPGRLKEALIDAFSAHRMVVSQAQLCACKLEIGC